MTSGPHLLIDLRTGDSLSPTVPTDEAMVSFVGSLFAAVVEPSAAALH